MAKIHCIITQADDNTLSASTLDLPAEYSADIKMQFVKNSNYSGYAVTPYFAVGYGTSVTVKTLTIDSDSCFVLPAEAFKQDATLSIAFALSDTSETIQTEPISFDIKASIGGTSVLPSDDPTWQQIVSSFLNSLMSSGMITTSNLQDGCVTTVKIADGAVSSSKIADGSITLAKLADEAIIKQKTVTGINVGTYAFLEGYEYIVDSTSTNVPLTGVSYIIRKIGAMVVAIMTSGSYIGWTFFATYGSITSASSWTSPFIVQ